METNVGFALLGSRLKHKIFSGQCTQEYLRDSETSHSIDCHLPEQWQANKLGSFAEKLRFHDADWSNQMQHHLEQSR